jgi:hypothetical protein
MPDISVTDLYAERQAGFDRRIPREPSTPPAPIRTRRGVRATPPAPADMPAEAGRHFVRLSKGKVYIVAGREGAADTLFEHDVVHEVYSEMHAHLANAIDVLPVFKDRELGRVVRRAHKFEASPPYEPIADEFPDLAAE